MTPKENKVLQQARNVYKGSLKTFYEETIRKTADELEKALTKLEELERDVKRFIDLYHAFEEHGLCGDEADEFLKLEEKLMGVGAKDV